MDRIKYTYKGDKRPEKGLFTGMQFYDTVNKNVSWWDGTKWEIIIGLNTRDPQEGEIFEIGVPDPPEDIKGNIIPYNREITIAEGGSFTESVRLEANPTNAQTINISSNNPKVTVNPTSLVFQHGEFPDKKEITITSIEDDVQDDITAIITYSSEGVPSVTASVTVTNNDIPEPPPVDVKGNLVVNPSSLTTDTKTPCSFTVKLDKQPTKNQIVTLTVNEEVATCDPSNKQLTFTPDNWNQEQTVTVTYCYSGQFENAQSLTAAISSVGVEDKYVSIFFTQTPEPPSGVFGEIVLQFETAEIKEGSGVNRGVTLDKAPTNNQVVNIESDQPWLTIKENSMTFTNENYNVMQYVLVSVKPNSITTDSVGHITFTSPNVAEKVITVTAKNVEPDRELQTSVINKDHLEVGSLENGEPTVENTQYRTKGFYGVTESSTYTFKEKNSVIDEMVYVFYDTDKRYLSQSDTHVKNMTTPSGCKYVKFRSYAEDESKIKQNLETIEFTLRKQVPITGISVSDQNIQLNSTIEIVPVFDPSDTSEREFELVPTNAEILQIVEGNKIKGIQVGSSTVTISSKTSPEVTSTFTVNVVDGPLELKSITLKAPDQMFPMNPQVFRVETDPANYPKDNLKVYGGSNSVVVEGSSFYMTDAGTFVLYADLDGKTDSKEIPCIIPSADAPTSIDFSELFKGYDFKVGRQYSVTTVVQPDGANNSIELSVSPTTNVVISGSTITFNKEGTYTLTVKSRSNESVTNSFVINPTVVALDSIKTQYPYIALSRDSKQLPWSFSPADAIGDIQLSATNDGLTSLERTNINQNYIELKPIVGQEKDFDLTISSIKNPEIKQIVHVSIKSLGNPSTVSYKGTSETLYDYVTGYNKNIIYGMDGSKVEYNVKDAVNNMTENYATLVVYNKFYSCNHYQGHISPFKIDWDGIKDLKVKQSDGSFKEVEKVVLQADNTRASNIPSGIKDIESVKFYKAEKKIVFTNHSRGFSYQYNLNTDMDTIEFDRNTPEITGNPDQIVAGGFAFYTSILTEEELKDAVERLIYSLSFEPSIYTPGYDKIITIGNDEENIESFGYLIPCDPRYKYESSAPEVVTVDNLGFIHPKTEGVAKITSKFTDYIIFDEMEIAIKPSEFTNEPVKIQGSKAIRIGEIMGGVMNE